MALPSGNGQADAAHSVSMVPASDSPAWPITGAGDASAANQVIANAALAALVAAIQAPGYEDGVANRALVEQRNAYQNITTNTTTVVKSGPGLLHALTFNKPVATAVVTIYDNTAASGTVIGTITVPASPQPFTLVFDVAFATGLTILTATAAQDITVSYR